MKIDSRTAMHKETNPIKAMTHAIIEQAVLDLVTLRRAGVIKGWEVIKEWPMWKGKPLKVAGFYKKTFQVQELVNFFKVGYCSRILNAIDSELDGDSVMMKLGEQK